VSAPCSGPRAGEDGGARVCDALSGAARLGCLARRAPRSWGGHGQPGGDGQPRYHVLVGTVAVCIGTAQARRSRPGKKPDQRDAVWRAARWAPGRLRPSCVPPPAMCAWRAVPRPRGALMPTRRPSQPRGPKLRAETNRTRGSGVSDLVGGTGWRLRAVVAGDRALQVGAALARGSLQRQRPQGALARTGRSQPWPAWALRAPSRVRRHRRAGVSLLRRLASAGPACRSTGRASAGVGCLLGVGYCVGIGWNVTFCSIVSHGLNRITILSTLPLLPRLKSPQVFW
jgi:hypothetical protein